MTQNELEEIHEELMKASIPSDRCHYCNQPVYRLPFQDTPRINETIMCLNCAVLLHEYEKVNEETT